VHSPIISSSVAYPALPCVSTLFHKRQDIRKSLLNIKCVFWFSIQLLSETFLILRKTDRDIIKKTRLVFMQNNRYSSKILMNLEFPGHHFEKYLNIKSNENHASGRRHIPCGYDEVNSRFSQFYECSQKLYLTHNITLTLFNIMYLLYLIYYNLLLHYFTCFWYVNDLTMVNVSLRSSGVARGWFGGFKIPPPRNSEGPPKSCQTQPDLKTVKSSWI